MLIRRPRFLWKLYAGYVVLILLTATVIAVVGARRLEKATLEETEEGLAADTVFLAGVAEPVLAGAAAADLEQEVRRLGRAIGKRLTVIAASGRVLADSAEDPRAMDNHGRRPEILDAARRPTGTSIRFSHTVNRELMYVARAVRRGGELLGTVRAAQSLATIEERVAELRWTVILGSAIAALVACLLGWIAAKRITGPLTSMKEAAEAMAAGDHGRRVAVGSNDEIGALARSFNQMAAELEERIDAMGREQAKLRSILASMVEGVVATDRAERVVHVNGVAADLLGIVAAEVLGKHLWEVTRFPRIGDAVADAMRTGCAATTEIQVGGQGAERTIQIRSSALRDGDGAVAGAVLVLHDVSELRRLEEVRRDFVSNVTHELKTPLTAIRGLVETMLDDDAMDPATRTRFLSRLRRQSDRLSNLVTDLLNLSRLESAEDTERSPVDVREPVRASVLHLRPEAAEKGLDLHADLPADAVRVLGDAEDLRQATDNLVQNAIRYTPAGGRVDIRLAARGAEAVLEVEDTGIGIDEKDRDRIFERFYRVDKARSRELGGTGLGLAIVKHVVLAHGGSVGVDSTAGRGSTFRLSLPILP